MENVYIFDLDGTLLDTLESLYISVNLTLKELKLREITRMQVRAFVGNGAKFLIEQAIQASVRGGGQQDDNATEVEVYSCGEELLVQGLNIYKRVFAEYCMYEVKPYEGVTEVLESLKSSGGRLAILSNKPHARTVEIVEEIFGVGYFDYIQGQSDAIPRKPDPESLRYVMAQLGVKKEMCIYIGDAETDLETGMKAQVKTIGVCWGFRDKAVLEGMNPAVILEEPLQILEYINHMD